MNITGMQEIITTRSDLETEAFGQRLVQNLTPGTVVTLYGDLGTGKTVMSRGIARGLGITEPVTSPTFTVVQEYQRPGGGWFFHLDMYRINNENDALAFGIEEFLFAPDAITVIEWPERIAGLLETDQTDNDRMPNPLPLQLEHVNDHERRITMPFKPT